jgi:type IV pilus assembly protein PilM
LGSLLSIDIGSNNIHIVEGSYSKGIISIELLNSFRIPKGIFNGEIIVNQDILSDALSDAIKATGSNAKEVALTINAIGAGVRDIDLPNSKPKELDQMIRNELFQTYHTLPSELIQYKLIEKITSDNGESLNRYRVASIDEEIVDVYRQIILKNKLKPLSLDININAIDKLFSMEMEINGTILDGAATMLIDFGGKSTTIYILSKGKPVFYRHLSIGSEQIENIIHDESLTSVADILKLKEEGVNFFAENENTSERYFNFLKQYFYNFNDEIRKIMGFYSSRTTNANIEQVYLFGGGSDLAGLTEYWSSSLGIPVDQIKDISRIKVKGQSRSIHNHINAIGALMRY